MGGIGHCRRVLVATTLVFLASPARAIDSAGPGLDLLVLADRSGSMIAHSSATIIDALPLTLNVVAWSAHTERVKHRFGVVSFGSHTQIDVPLTIVDADNVSRLRDRIGALGSQSLGSTNFSLAFEAAAEIFRALPADARRRRAILLLTDGHAHVPGVRESVVAENLERLVASKLTRPSVTIDVLLYGNDRVPPLWRRVSRGRVHAVQGDRGDVLATLHRAVTSMIGTRSAQHDVSASFDTLVLPPYLELVVFDIFRGVSAKEISLVPPGSTATLNSQTPGVEEIHVGDVLSTIVVRRPAPGAWTFHKSDSRARVKVLSQQFFPRGVLVDPAAAPPVRQHDEVTIGYRLDDGAGRPLQELPGYPLSVDVSVAVPDGRRVVLPMRRESTSLYRATSVTNCDAPGRYWTEVLVTTADSTGQPVRIFEDRWSGFAVEAVNARAVYVSTMPLSVEVARARGRLPLAIILGLALPLAALLLFAMRRR